MHGVCGRASRCLISYKFPNDVHAAGPGTTLNSRDLCHTTGRFANTCHCPSGELAVSTSMYLAHIILGGHRDTEL